MPRTIKIIKTVYTYNELLEMGNDEVIKKAQNELRTIRLDSTVDIYFDEFLRSMRAFLDIFNVKVQDWQFDVDDTYNNYITTNTSNFSDLTTDEKHEIIETYIQSKHTPYQFTGVYTDAYPVDMTKEMVGNVTLGNVMTILTDMPTNALLKFKDDECAQADDLEYQSDVAHVNNWHFLSDGTFYGSPDKQP